MYIDNKSLPNIKNYSTLLCVKAATTALQNKNDEPSASTNPYNLKTASDFRSETVYLINSKFCSRYYTTSSVDDYLNWETKDSSNMTLTSSSHLVAEFYIVRSKPIQTSSSSCARWKPSSISVSLRQYTQPNSSTSGSPLSSPSDIPLSLRPPYGIETSITIHSDPRHTHPIGDQGSVFSLSAFNTADLLYHTLGEISRLPTPDPL